MTENWVKLLERNDMFQNMNIYDPANEPIIRAYLSGNLQFYANFGMIDELKSVLTYPNIDIEINEGSIIKVCIHNNQVECVKLIFEYTKDIKPKFKNMGLISSCIASKRYDILKYLLSRGIEPETTDIECAYLSGQTFMFHLLLNYCIPDFPSVFKTNNSSFDSLYLFLCSWFNENDFNNPKNIKRERLWDSNISLIVASYAFQ
jgi:hypothetical protein